MKGANIIACVCLCLADIASLLTLSTIFMGPLIKREIMIHSLNDAISKIVIPYQNIHISQSLICGFFMMSETGLQRNTVCPRKSDINIVNRGGALFKYQLRRRREWRQWFAKRD